MSARTALSPGIVIGPGKSLALYCRARFGPGLDVARAESQYPVTVAARMVARIEGIRTRCPLWDHLIERIGPDFGDVPLPWRPRIADVAGALDVDFRRCAEEYRCARDRIVAGGHHRLMIRADAARAVLVAGPAEHALRTDHALVWHAAGLLHPAPERHAWQLASPAPRQPARRDGPDLRRSGLWVDAARRARAARIRETFAAARMSRSGSTGLKIAHDRLGAVLWSVVSGCFGEGCGFGDIEARLGLPHRSAKALLAVAVDLWPESAL